MKTTNIFLIFLVFPVLISCKKTNSEPSSQSHWATAIEMNQRLGRGINMGNTFEADQLWQSPFDADDFRKIAELGFTHVRVPIKWERDDRSMSTSPYTIYPEFLETVKSVVDTALKNKLHIIINMHHHNDLMADPQGQKSDFCLNGSKFRNISRIILTACCLKY